MDEKNLFASTCSHQKKTKTHGKAEESKLMIFCQVKLRWPTIDIDGVVSNVLYSPAFIGSSIRQPNVLNGQFTTVCRLPCPRCRTDLLMFVIEPSYVVSFIFKGAENTLTAANVEF